MYALRCNWHKAAPPNLRHIMASPSKTSASSQLPEIENPLILTGLDLYDENLTALPPQIEALKKLEKLSLRWNKLQTLPPELDPLTNLERLWLKNNQLQTLPDTLLDIPNVRVYVLGNPDLQVWDALRESGKFVLANTQRVLKIV